jgi:hypothetical protein
MNSLKPMPVHASNVLHRKAFVAIGSLLLAAALRCPAQAVKPLPGNPGNIFTAGQTVSIPVPAGGNWTATDYDGKVVSRGKVENGRANLGNSVPIGFYTISTDANAQVTAAVIAALVAPTPSNTPLGTNTAQAWFYSTPQQWQAVSNLVSLAGMKWVREQYTLQEMEPQRGQFSPPNRQDQSMQIAHNAGLSILKFGQTSPPWAQTGPVKNLDRFPDDLRDVYNFYRALAARWHGTASAMEPWNESDMVHSGAEIASFQKAAYLGIKAGDPNMPVLLDSFGKPGDYVLNNFINNSPGNYFDIYNFHHYFPLPALPDLYQRYSKASFGKPIWVTEFNFPQQRAENSKNNDPSTAGMRAETNLLVELYATTLNIGANLPMWFIFGDYVESGNQFGVVHKDLTPRPAFLALAATGRFLAGAQPLGKIQGAASGTPSVYAFSSFPDGKKSDVLIAWADSGNANLNLPVAPLGISDALGRPLPGSGNGRTVLLGAAPVFIHLPPGTVSSWASSKAIKLVPPPAQQRAAAQNPSPVVLQALFGPTQLSKAAPQPHTIPNASADILPGGRPSAINLYAYNFSNVPIQANLDIKLPGGWQYSLSNKALSLSAQARVQIPLTITPPAGSYSRGTILIQAQNQAGRVSVLSLDVVPQ